MNTEKLRKEEAAFYFCDEKEFIRTLSEIEGCDEWIDTAADTLHVKALSEYPPEMLKQFESSTGLVLQANGEEYPLYEIALPSIRRRARNNAEIFNVLQPEDAAKMLNISWNYCTDRKCRILARAGAVLAVHSDRYVALSQSLIFEKLESYLSDAYDEVGFCSGSYTHTTTHAKYEIFNSGLLGNLKNALLREGITACDDIRVFIDCRTSDSGTESVRVSPSISVNHCKETYFTNGVSMPHRDKTDLNSIESGFEDIFSIVREGIENLERLLGIHLTYPAVILMKLCKDRKTQIPRTLIEERNLVNQFAFVQKTGQTVTAYDFFFTISEIFSSPLFEKLSPERRLRLRDSVAKIAFYTQQQWEKLDVNDVVW